MARFRLAQSLLDEKRTTRPLRAIDVKTDDAFAAIYADLRGDILAAAGKAPTRGRRTRVRVRQTRFEVCLPGLRAG